MQYGLGLEEALWNFSAVIINLQFCRLLEFKSIISHHKGCNERKPGCWFLTV